MKKLIALLVICGLLFGSINFVFASEKKLNPISWKTNTVQLSAINFYIIVDGKTFIPNNTTKINSDPGNPNYTTLEVTWFQNGIEMRMNLYFASDQKNWWIAETRVYNGKNPANWITLEKMLLKTAQNKKNYQKGNFSIEISKNASIYFENLVLSTTTKLKNEISIPICTEIFLKKGTIIRSSNIALLTEKPTVTSPKYTTKYTGEDQLVFLTKDTQIYLTDGGAYTKKINLENYLNELLKIGVKIKIINIQ